MLTLITGLPGSGKTLNLLKIINESESSKSRPIYYFNIKKLIYKNWVELSEEEAIAWYDLPEGSIIVLDECQSIFPPRKIGALVPKSVEQLSVHRHKGYDLYIITQAPTLIDSAVRKLVGSHLHFERILGSSRVKCFSWEKVANDPNSSQARKDSLIKQVTLDKKYFNVYHSAEIHTHSKKLPVKFYLAIVALLALFFMVYTVYDRLMQKQENVSSVDNKNASSQSLQLNSEQDDKKVLLNAKQQYLYMLTPRVVDLEYTAPIYDNLTKPKSFPKPTCVLAVKRNICKCYSQQATRLSVGQQMCKDIVKNGWFDFTKKDSKPSNHNVVSQEGERERAKT